LVVFAGRIMARERAGSREHVNPVISTLRPPGGRRPTAELTLNHRLPS
jgi:hypothetical protein